MCVSDAFADEELGSGHYGNQSWGSLMVKGKLWPPAVPQLAARPSQWNPRGSGPEVLKRERGHVTAEIWSFGGGGLQGPPTWCTPADIRDLSRDARTTLDTSKPIQDWRRHLNISPKLLSLGYYWRIHTPASVSTMAVGPHWVTTQRPCDSCTPLNQVITGSANGLALNSWQAISWTIADVLSIG